MSQLFTPGGQSIRASASVLPVNIQGLFPLGLTVKGQLTQSMMPKSQVQSRVQATLFGLLSKEVANCLEKRMASHFSILALKTS